MRIVGDVWEWRAASEKLSGEDEKLQGEPKKLSGEAFERVEDCSALKYQARIFVHLLTCWIKCWPDISVFLYFYLHLYFHLYLQSNMSFRSKEEEDGGAVHLGRGGESPSSLVRGLCLQDPQRGHGTFLSIVFCVVYPHILLLVLVSNPIKRWCSSWRPLWSFRKTTMLAFGSQPSLSLPSSPPSLR